jgi:hypothetical protein
MLFRAPRTLPAPQFLFDDLRSVGTVPQLAKYIGLAPSTLERYIKTSNIPRAVHLALFWETKWGISCNDVDLYNTAQVHREHAKSLGEKVVHLCGVIDQLEQELGRMYQEHAHGHWHQAANSPQYQVR